MSNHVMSCHVTSRHVMSCHVILRHVMSRHVMSFHITLCYAMLFHVSNRVMYIFSSYTPADVHTHLEEDMITLEITLADDKPPQHCFNSGLRYHFTHTYPEHPVISRVFSCYYQKQIKNVRSHLDR